jgi:glycerol-3-phosphate acyltransferase PlsY
LLAAAAGLIGNNWPVYYRFKGGSGISAIYGGLLVIDPLAILVSAAGGLLIGLVICAASRLMFIAFAAVDHSLACGFVFTSWLTWVMAS